MSRNLVTGDIIMENDEYKIVTEAGKLVTIGDVSTSVVGATITAAPISNGGTISNVTIRQSFDMDDFLDQHIMNRVTVDHKVQEQELMKLREHAPDYANEIKENIAKNCARDMVKKLTFTKKHDKDADVHHFIGRVWMFTEEELKTLLIEARNV